MKADTVNKFMSWPSFGLIALIFCWYKEPEITDFLCTAMAIFCALFSALTVAEMRDAKNQIEQKSSDPDSNTSERMNEKPVRRIIRREYRANSVSVHARNLRIKKGRRKKYE